MELMCARCAGLDVHKDSVVACVRIQTKERVTHEVRTFGTTTGALLELADWLRESGCSHAALESTGVYWKPVWHVLASAELKLWLANAEHVRNVPGRKTDVRDSVWLADLLAHGLIESSFVPPERIVELRDLTRTRRQMVRQRVRHVQRIQKTLEDANIKLDSVISDCSARAGVPSSRRPSRVSRTPARRSPLDATRSISSCARRDGRDASRYGLCLTSERHLPIWASSSRRRRP